VERGTQLPAQGWDLCRWRRQRNERGADAQALSSAEAPATKSTIDFFNRDLRTRLGWLGLGHHIGTGAISGTLA
jgi:hypothetical protein